MTRIIAALLLAALSLLALARPLRTGRTVLASASGQWAWLEELQRLRLSAVRRPMVASRRPSHAAGNSGPAPAAGPVRRARIRKPHLGDGVVGFVCGLILVTVVLAAAVAFAAQPVP